MYIPWSLTKGEQPLEPCHGDGCFQWTCLKRGGDEGPQYLCALRRYCHRDEDMTNLNGWFAAGYGRFATSLHIIWTHRKNTWSEIVERLERQPDSLRIISNWPEAPTFHASFPCRFPSILLWWNWTKVATHFHCAISCRALEVHRRMDAHKRAADEFGSPDCTQTIVSTSRDNLWVCWARKRCGMVSWWSRGMWIECTCCSLL